MSIFGRLHLDEIMTTIPELGPTVPYSGYSWIILIAIMIIQMTVPSVLSMYGVVLGNIVVNKNVNEFSLFNEKIILTPILLVAFWNLSDPWTGKIVKLASVPRLVALIGIILLSVGVLASGYLATGGVGAYFASLSAGIVMGIGSSLVLTQSENVLREHFRSKLLLATSLKNVAFSLGFILSPIFTLTLFEQNAPQSALLMMAIVFIPSIFASLLLQTPRPRQPSPYSLLISEEEENNELLTRNSYQFNAVDKGYLKNSMTTAENIEGSSICPISNEGSIAFAYDDYDDDDDDDDDDDEEHVRAFVTTSRQISFCNWWRSEIKILRYYKFLLGIIAWIGIKAANLFLWILFPPVAIIQQFGTSATLRNAVALSVVSGIGCFVMIIISHWKPNTLQVQSLLFTCSLLLSGIVFLGFPYQNEYIWLNIFALLGGISMGGLTVSQDSFLQHLMLNGTLARTASNKLQIILSTSVGIAILLLFITPNALMCLKIISGIQLLAGICLIVSFALNFIKTRNICTRPFLNR